MATNALVGCWGVIVGIVLAVFLGWMGFELLVHFFTTADLEGFAGALLNAVFHHKAGEFLVVLAIIVATYTGVFRGTTGLRAILPSLRALLWTGAALNVLAMVELPAGRWSWWVVTLVVVGFAVPLLLRGISAPEPTPGS